MSQIQIAGSRITSTDELPKTGVRFPDFELPTECGCPMRLSDLRGRSDAVIVFTDDRSVTEKLLVEVADHYVAFKNEEAAVIAVIRGSTEECARLRERLRLPFAVLPDFSGSVYRLVGANDNQGHAAAALYVTDRYGEVFASFRTRDGQTLPSVSEILEWLEFVNIQCPECEPPEWPV